MTLRTLTLKATNVAGSVSASADVTIADVPGSGNVIELVGTNLMKDVDPDPLRKAVYSGVGGQGLALADSGMTYCPWYGPAGAVVFTGGGHADYGGNEVYVFDLNTMTWSRINNPSTAVQKLVFGAGDPVGVDLVHGEFSDGSPCSSHTYSHLTAIPGGNKGLLLKWCALSIPWSGGTNCAWTHVCDLETGVWSRFSVNAPPTMFGNTAADAVCYDAARGRVWGAMRSNGVNHFSYLDLATRTHQPALPFYIDTGYIPTCARVAVHDLMLLAGANYSPSTTQPMPFKLTAVNLANPNAAQLLNLVGDLPPPTAYCAYGFDWDTDRDCGYVYRGNWTWGTDLGQDDNAHVWRVDPPTGNLLTAAWTLTKIALPSSLPRQVNGVYSRWRYCSGVGKFALLSTVGNKIALWTPPA